MRAGSVVVVVPLGLALSALVGCSRPPVTAEGEGEGEADRVVVNLPAFLQDRPAIGGKWYEYSVDGHILEPKDEAWVVIAGDGSVHGFEIASVYDDDTGESGRFSLNVVDLDAEGAWTAPRTYVSITNVKDGPPVCMNLGTLLEQSCASEGWDLRFVLQNRLSVFAGFAVAEPALYVNDDVRLARVDGAALADLPAPDALSDLADADATFATTDWDFAALAPNLPRKGQVFGALERVAGEPFGLFDGNRGLVEFSVVDVDAATLRFTLRRAQVEIDDGSVPKDLGPFRDVDVDVSAPPVFLSFINDDLLALPEDLTDASWPTRPPFSRDYDLVVVADEDEDDDAGGGVRLLLSPASAALHASAE